MSEKPWLFQSTVVFLSEISQLVSWSLTSLFSTNMAVSETIVKSVKLTK